MGVVHRHRRDSGHAARRSVGSIAAVDVRRSPAVKAGYILAIGITVATFVSIWQATIALATCPPTLKISSRKGSLPP